MEIDRRTFVALSCGATAVACSGCAASGGGETERGAPAGPVDAGPVAAYAADGVYDRFRDRGFVIIRHGESLRAISAICTHRRCKLTVERDHSFYCKCHGSTFDPNGKVTHGPATRDLPTLPSSVNEAGHLIVEVPGR